MVLDVSQPPELMNLLADMVRGDREELRHD
jgi:hypothetical protein